MRSEEDYKIVETMERFGGSFVQALAVCFRRADFENYMKLRMLFDNYWEQYRSMAGIVTKADGMALPSDICDSDCTHCGRTEECEETK